MFPLLCLNICTRISLVGLTNPNLTISYILFKYDNIFSIYDSKYKVCQNVPIVSLSCTIIPTKFLTIYCYFYDYLPITPIKHPLFLLFTKIYY